MCEFCTKHGEGKKWYLEMKNYSDELLQAPLTTRQQKIVGTRTRIEWVDRFLSGFVMPAVKEEEKKRGANGSGETSSPPKHRPSEREAVRAAQVVHFGQVLPIEDVEAVIDKVDSITRLACGCRYISTGKTDKRYCFGVAVDPSGILGRFPDGSFEVLSKDKAKKIFRDYDREGLIHSIWTAVTPFVIGICNCDRDCMAYKYYIEQKGAPTFFRAEYIARVDWNLCLGCKSCMRQCQFGALFYSHQLARVYIDPLRCFGCGVCRAGCEQNAITLIPRPEHPEAAQIWLKSP
jgi:NAD-dependent dihydropyrimidine dehydrogenase PreA subunit